MQKHPNIWPIVLLVAGGSFVIIGVLVITSARDNSRSAEQSRAKAAEAAHIGITHQRQNANRLEGPREIMIALEDKAAYLDHLSDANDQEYFAGTRSRIGQCLAVSGGFLVLMAVRRHRKRKAEGPAVQGFSESHATFP